LFDKIEPQTTDGRRLQRIGFLTLWRLCRIEWSASVTYGEQHLSVLDGQYELLWGFPRFTQSDRDLFFTLTAPEREALERGRSVRTNSESSGAVYRYWSEDTLCRRDKRATYRHRLRILERAESHLKGTD
jgi:hypothetical protein